MALQRRRQRKQLERQNRLDTRIIANAPIPAQEANYRRATGEDKCTLCRFNTRENFCELFSFDFVVGFTCDRFEAREEMARDDGLGELFGKSFEDDEFRWEYLRQKPGYDALIEHTKSQSSYWTSIRAAARGLWSKRIDIFDFINAMSSAIDRNYERAWREGAKTCGIRPNERTAGETNALNGLIVIAKSSVFDFGEFIEARQDEPFSSLSSRIDVWANRYSEVKSRAQTMSCQNQKLEWRIGDADHCKTCLKLNGRVMRASRWQELDVYPQDTRSGKLECKGFNCDCRLVSTDKRGTPGRLPGLP